MKKLAVLGMGVCIVLAFSSCKSSESAYKKAYEKAKQQELAEPQTTAPVEEVAPVVSAPVEGKVVESAPVGTIREEKVLFGDGSHILYVNGKYRGDDEVGKLMHDFSCTDPDDMNYEILAKKARYFKQDEKGVATMCKLMEDMRNEAAHEAAHKAERESARKTAKRFLKMGKLSHEEISDGTGLPLEEVKALEEEIMQLA